MLDRLEQHTARLGKLQLWLGVLTLPIYFVGLFCFFHRWVGRKQLAALRSRGVLAWAQIQKGPRLTEAEYESIRSGQTVVVEAEFVTLLLGRFLPIITCDYTVELAGKKHYWSNWIYLDEIVVTNSAGACLVLLDPERPWLYRQLVLRPRIWGPIESIGAADREYKGPDDVS